MTETDIPIYEVPAIQGFIPRLFSRSFDDGIPKELWRDVITVYADGDKLQRFTGNQLAQNARVILLEKNGHVMHFYDRGFSVNALNELRESINALAQRRVNSGLTLHKDSHFSHD